MQGSAPTLNAKKTLKWDGACLQDRVIPRVPSSLDCTAADLLSMGHIRQLLNGESQKNVTDLNNAIRGVSSGVISRETGIRIRRSQAPSLLYTA